MTKFIKEKLILDAETKQLLDKRLEAHRNNPNEGSEWEVVKARIMDQLLRH